MKNSLATCIQALHLALRYLNDLLGIFQGKRSSSQLQSKNFIIHVAGQFIARPNARIEESIRAFGCDAFTVHNTIQLNVTCLLVTHCEPTLRACTAFGELGVLSSSKLVPLRVLAHGRAAYSDWCEWANQ